MGPQLPHVKGQHYVRPDARSRPGRILESTAIAETPCLPLDDTFGSRSAPAGSTRPEFSGIVVQVVAEKCSVVVAASSQMHARIAD